VTVTVRELAEWVSGEVIGDGHLGITSARPLRDAQNGDLSFLEDEKYLSLAESSHAAALVVGPKTTLPTKTLIRVADPLMAFVHVFAQLHGIAEPEPTGIDSLARLHPSVEVGEAVFIDAHVSVGAGSTIGKGTRIHAGVVIGRNCHIAEDVILYPNVAIYDGTLIGNRVIIHANAVIGADGFGYRTQKGRHVKVPQLGHVEIADDVEIGACTTIDRGTFGATRIGEGTKIDNMVMIGHNCQIGKHNLLVSQVGIAGSCTTGDYVVMAGQVGIADHCTIGEFTQLGAKCGVHKNVPSHQRMLGAPATPDKEQMRIMMSLERLPDLRRDVKRIKDHLGLSES